MKTKFRWLGLLLCFALLLGSLTIFVSAEEEEATCPNYPFCYGYLDDYLTLKSVNTYNSTQHQFMCFWQERCGLCNYVNDQWYTYPWENHWLSSTYLMDIVAYNNNGTHSIYKQYRDSCLTSGCSYTGVKSVFQSTAACTYGINGCSVPGCR